MPETRAKLGDFGFVRIFRPTREPVGAGFLFASNRVLTCAHVVTSVLGQEAWHRHVMIDFPLIGANGPTQPALVEHLDVTSDVAILLLEDEPPESAIPYPLVGGQDASGHSFAAFGFPPGRDDGVSSYGRIRDRQSRGWYQLESDSVSGYPIRHGFSGGPLWDETLQAALGVVAVADKDPLTRAAFCIPVVDALKPWLHDRPDIEDGIRWIDKLTPDTRPRHIASEFPPLTHILPPSSIGIQRDSVLISADPSQDTLVRKLRADLEAIGHRVSLDFEFLGPASSIQAWSDTIHASTILIAVQVDDAETMKRQALTAIELGEHNGSIVGIRVEFQTGWTPPAATSRVFDFSEYGRGLRDLLEARCLPTPARVSMYCRQAARELEEIARQDDWQMELFIPEQSRYLPVHASPYSPGALRGEPADLVARLHELQETIVLGEPGAGKTVALQRFAWELTQKPEPDLPVLIHLAEFRGESLAGHIKATVLSRRWLGTDFDPVNIDRLLNSFHGYLLLDGLNEVAEDQQAKLITEILGLPKAFPSFRIVVSSRIQDEGWRVLQERRQYKTLLVQALSEDNARQYLRSYLGIDQAERLWSSLDGNVRGLIRTPLLLRLLRESWLGQQDRPMTSVPASRGDLYESFVLARLNVDYHTRRLSDPRARAALEALETLALAMQEQEVLGFRETEILQILTEDQLRAALRLHGFLIGEGQLRFFHHTFQEYFAARALSGREYAPYVHRKAQSHAWAETFIQLAGLLRQPDPLIRALGDSNPWLAWWCIAEGNAVLPETLERVKSATIDQANSPDVVQRRKAAESLSAMSLDRAIPPLVNLAKDLEEDVAALARRGLDRHGLAATRAVLEEFMLPTLSVPARVQLGAALAWMGDPRPGVGLSPSKIPLLTWVHIPAGILEAPSGPTIQISAFLASSYHITRCQWNSFVEAEDGYVNEQWWTRAGPARRPPYFRVPATRYGSTRYLDNEPVTFVSWFEAMAFCAWLSHKTQSEVRLPTEREWLRLVHWTEHLAAQGPVCANTLENGTLGPSPVGAYVCDTAPSTLCDVRGNVFSWCSTQWSSTGDHQIDGDLQRISPRVLRGGSFTHSRALDRLGDEPHGRHGFAGFRVVRSVDHHA